MDHDHFDQLAKTLASGASRRTVLGGAIAGIIGTSLASVTAIAAKGNKHRGQHNRKKGKGKKAGAEFTCTAANANNPALGGCPPFTCCASTAGGLGPQCVDFGAQSGSQFCGSGGVGVCRTCPAGTKCSGFPFFRCVCDNSTCSTGCCINNAAIAPANTVDDQCVQNGSGTPVSSVNPAFDGDFVCGTGGSLCSNCGSTIFAGCCTAGGTCSLGTTGNNCGNSGELCEVCTDGAECGADQTCSGGTTTTTTTTTAAPCAGKLCASGTCCPNNKVCKSGGGCKNKRKKKK